MNALYLCLLLFSDIFILYFNIKEKIEKIWDNFGEPYIPLSDVDDN